MLSPIHSKEALYREEEKEAEERPSERLTSISLMDVDAEELHLPLKSILKRKPFDQNQNQDDMLSALKVCALIVMIFSIPIVLSDLYFAFADSPCINDTPRGLYLSLKNYLTVSGIMGLWTMACIVALSFVKEMTRFTIWGIRLVGLVNVLFCFIWNILGGIVFWGTVYPQGNCDLNLSTYMYISLIIKIVANLYTISLK